MAVFVCYFLIVVNTDLRFYSILNNIALAHLGILSVLYISGLIIDRNNNRKLSFVSSELSTYSYDIYLVHYMAAVWPLGIILFRTSSYGYLVPNIVLIITLPAIIIILSILISRHLFRKATVSRKILLGN